jgi:hypothetical protein
MKRILLLLLLLGCSRSEVINEPPREFVDTMFTRARNDTTERRIPIGFGVTVEDWKYD